MKSPLRYALLIILLSLFVIYIAFGQVKSIRTRSADNLKLDWVTIWTAPEEIMAQIPAFSAGPFVYVEQLDLEAAGDSAIYTAGDKLRRINAEKGIAWETSMVLDEDVIPSAIYFRDVYVDEAGDVYGLGHIRYQRESHVSTVEDEEIVKTMFLTKHSSDGTLLWQDIWDEEISGRVWGLGILSDSDGNPVIFGNCEISMDFDPGGGEEIYLNESNPKRGGDPDAKLDVDDYDGFALRLTPDGDYINSYAWSGTIYSCIRALDGEFIFAGNNTEDEVTGETSPDSCLMSLKPDFSNAKRTDMDPPLRSALIRDLDADIDGNIYLVGILKLEDRIDGILCRLDSEYQTDWCREWGEIDNEVYPLSLDVSASGNIYLTGGFACTSESRLLALDFDPGKRKDLHAGPYYEIFVTKYSSEGEYKWTGSFGNDRNDWAGGISVGSDGKITILGYFQGTVDFDPSPGEMSQSARSEIGGFIAQFSEIQDN